MINVNVEQDVRNMLSESGAGIVDLVTGEVKICDRSDVIRRLIPETYVNWKRFRPEEGEVILIAKDPEIERKLRNKWKRLEERGLCEDCEGTRLMEVSGVLGNVLRRCKSCNGSGIKK